MTRITTMPRTPRQPLPFVVPPPLVGGGELHPPDACAHAPSASATCSHADAKWLSYPPRCTSLRPRKSSSMIPALTGAADERLGPGARVVVSPLPEPLISIRSRAAAPENHAVWASTSTCSR